MPADLPETASHPVGDRTARQRFIMGSSWWTVPATLAAVAAGHALAPQPPGMEDAAARVVLALRWLPVALAPYVATCLWIHWQRFAEGAHNPLAGAESESLKIHCRVMQNTLEQFVWFAVALLALAASLPARDARVLPVLCVVFAAIRCVYWWGYRRHGTIGRAPGVQMTLALNGAMTVHLVKLALVP